MRRPYKFGTEEVQDLRSIIWGHLHWKVVQKIKQALVSSTIVNYNNFISIKMHFSTTTSVKC